MARLRLLMRLILRRASVCYFLIDRAGVRGEFKSVDMPRRSWCRLYKQNKNEGGDFKFVAFFLCPFSYILFLRLYENG